MRTTGFTLVLLSLSMLACDQPSAPGEGAPSRAVNDGSEGTLHQLMSGAKASGHVAVQATPVQNIRDEQYSFTAIAAGEFPAAKGQVEVHVVRFTGEEITVHAEVTCLSIVGNEAFVGSRVIKYLADGEEVSDRIGVPMVFRVVDMGEGENVTELASLVLFSLDPGRYDLLHCTTRPDFPILRSTTTGNIQVNGD